MAYVLCLHTYFYVDILVNHKACVTLKHPTWMVKPT